MTEQNNGPVEQELLRQLDAIEVRPYNETMDAIRSRMTKHKEKQKEKKRAKRIKTAILSAVASFVLLFGIGTAVFLFADRDRNLGNDSPYEDKDIEILDYTESDFLERPIYQPQIEILSDRVFKNAWHEKSKKTIYFIVSGEYRANDISSHVDMRIFLHPQYKPTDETDYLKTSTVNISDKTISVYEHSFEDSIYLYKLGFNIGVYRYYIDYRTPEKDSYSAFLQEFLH